MGRGKCIDNQAVGYMFYLDLCLVAAGRDFMKIEGGLGSI
jgi:hypothetical protein